MQSKKKNQKGLVIPANYKTQLCRNWQKDKKCPYGKRCVYAHDLCELRTIHINLIAMAHVAWIRTGKDAYGHPNPGGVDPNYFYASMPCIDNPNFYYNPYNMPPPPGGFPTPEEWMMAAGYDPSSGEGAPDWSTASEEDTPRLRQPTPPVFYNAESFWNGMAPWMGMGMGMGMEGFGDPWTVSNPPTPTGAPDGGELHGTKKKKKKRNKKKKKKNQAVNDSQDQDEGSQEDAENEGLNESQDPDVQPLDTAQATQTDETEAAVEDAEVEQLLSECTNPSVTP
eukprot:TRINITY_DN66888_c4_g6_i1.p1 TRINITY_DN66888_c4_g6~~TRINITY_DN66888_c4_g6_i1.p1  ORF type:complete len:282 (-),score=33.09 TRINITY_DN66888_c4_g6_i1:483-1328(-)